MALQTRFLRVPHPLSSSSLTERLHPEWLHAAGVEESWFDPRIAHLPLEFVELGVSMPAALSLLLELRPPEREKNRPVGGSSIITNGEI
jgi:hypothetical protein